MLLLELLPRLRTLDFEKFYRKNVTEVVLFNSLSECNADKEKGKVYHGFFAKFGATAEP